MNAFYLAGAVLVELEVLVNGLTKYFSDSPDFMGVLLPVIHSPEFTEVVARYRKLRKWSAFHFDEQAAKDILQGRNEDFERFLSAQGTRNRDYYYDLGDIVAFGLISGGFASPEAFEEWATSFLKNSADVTNKVLTAADTFIGTQVAKWDVARRQVRDMPSNLSFELSPEVEAMRALERFRDELRRAESDPYDWKWAIIAGHNALQAFMVAALDSTARTGLFSRNSIREFEDWWRSRDEARNPPEPELASFMLLFGRLNLPFNVREDMDAINNWRKDFSHFLYSTWVVSVRPLPRRFLSCLRLIEYVGWEPGRIQWQDEVMKLRAQRAYEECVAISTRMKAGYESEV
jgi:hypothetical protein